MTREELKQLAELHDENIRLKEQMKEYREWLEYMELKNKTYAHYEEEISFLIAKTKFDEIFKYENH